MTSKRITAMITKARTAEEIKEVLFAMNEKLTATQTANNITKQKAETWIRSIKSDFAKILEAGLIDVYRNPKTGQLYADFDPDGLTSLQFINSTKKKWVCHDCKKDIPTQSQAFRSFKRITERTFDKRYRCTSCIKALVDFYDGEGNEAIHHMAYMDALRDF
jgi:hypothetical protein